MRRFTLVLLSLVLGFGLAFSQTKVNGVILSADDGEPIFGATIVVKGKTATGTTSDLDGKFSMNVPANTTLVISYLGFESQEVAGKANMKVLLKESTRALDEVMVVAFGTSTKKSFTGAATVMKQEDIEKRQASNITTMIAGQVSGVQGINSNGAPGATSAIRIRGVGSLYASNAPLYVVDGIPFDGDISSINNSDIESVTVLKDAASNALYGARGANGVIILTTKRGRSSDAVVTFDAKWGNNMRGISSYDAMTDPGMYYEKFYEGLYNGYKTSYGDSYTADLAAYNALFNSSEGGLGYNVYSVPNGERVIGSNGKLNPAATLGRVDGNYLFRPDNWFDEVFKKNNLRQEYNLSISAGGEKSNYFISAGYLDDTGIIAKSGFKRFTSRLKMDSQVKKWLKVGANLSYTNTQNNYSEDQEDDRSSANIFYVTNIIAPIFPLYIRNSGGNIMKDSRGYTMYDFGDGRVWNAVRGFMPQSNPASNLELDNSDFVDDNISAKWFAEVSIWKGLKALANFGANAANSRHRYSMNPYYGQYVTTGGIAGVRQTRTFSLNQQYLLTYNNKTKTGHNFDVLAGYESYAFKRSRISGSKEKMFDATVPEIDNAINSPSIYSWSKYYGTVGFLSQVKYDWKSKYYASLSYRRDASSVFHPDNRWGNFWSVGLAWDIKGEDFMADVTWLDMLKLKGSYGAQGNDYLVYDDGSRNYTPYQDQFLISSNNGEFATTLSYKGNKDITWETSLNTNIGVDFAMFNQKLGGTVEYFSRQTKDMLYNKPVPSSLGYSTIPVNVGSMRNIGAEIDLYGVLVKTRSLEWRLSANATFLKNKIISLDPSLGGKFIDGSRMYKEGESMYNLYITEYAGVNPENGNSLWYMDTKDDQGNVISKGGTTDQYSNAQRYETGSIMPKVYGGFGTSLTVKSFDVSVQCAYQLGGRMMDYTYQNLMHGGNSNGTNFHKDILNSWTPTNTETDVPAVNAVNQDVNRLSTRFLTSSNFLALQNITIGYTLPKRLSKQMGLVNLRVYGVADNVALLSARKGFDPRQGYVGSEATYYSPMRTISGGLKVTF